MSRLSYFASNPKRVLGVVAALGASAAVVATGASFTYDTDSAASAFKTGTFVMKSQASLPAFGDDLRLNILPGEGSNVQRAIENSSTSTYNAKCKLRLTASDVTTGTDPQTGAAGDSLLDFVKIGVTDFGAGGSEFGGGVYAPAAALSGLPAEINIAGVIKPGERRVIGFGWKTANGGRGADNKFESASLNVNASWLCDATKATS